MTLSALAISKKRLDTIESDRLEVKDSASLDLEWIQYKGKYEHGKTKIFAACFCTNWGERIVLHISNYYASPDPEKALIQDILFYLNQFPLTFGWYTTGVAVYDDTGENRIKGRDSDFYVLHQRCLLYHLASPIEVKKTYCRLADPIKKHIDLNKVFGKPIIQNGVFEAKYRTTDLDSVSQALVGVGKYGKLNAGISDIASLPIEEQERYVRRDSELVMMLAQYNNCLVLRIMRVFAKYARMDYYHVCHTEISTWYSNLYRKMLESEECTVYYTPNYKLSKQKIGGGHHTTPVRAFYVGTKVYELDIKGQYPNIVINNNFSFDTINCICCKYNEIAQVKQETIDIINEQLQEDKIPRKVDRYWICQNRKGAFHKVLEQTLSDRSKYLSLLKEEKQKPEYDSKLIEEYQTHQLGAKLFANAGFGLFGNEYFEYSNYQVAELITAEGRRIHKQMESLAHSEPFNFKIVFGFTDSIFFEGRTKELMQDFIQVCKDKLGFIVELKNIFFNSIFYAKKNRYVAWTGNEKDKPIIKGLDGLSDSNPFWIRKLFRRIVIEIIKHPETRFEAIPRIIEKAFNELDEGQINPEEELKYTQRLNLYPYEYKDHVRTGVIAKQLNKDKGGLIYWYETFREEYDKSKQCLERRNSYAIKPENLNLEKYKNLLLNKLKDTLEIVGMDLGLSHRKKLRLEDNKSMLVPNSVDLRGVHPLVKWAGGKGQQLSELNKMIPSQFNTYFEPFLGGGAMFFYLVSINLRFSACLSDINANLVACFQTVKYDPNGLTEALAKYEKEYKGSSDKESYYYGLRDDYNHLQDQNLLDKSARFIALNKICYNGMYRVNQKGEFNVPWGKYYNTPTICDGDNLRKVSIALNYSDISISTYDYETALSDVTKDDFVYLDPPYHPTSITANFTDYSANGFSEKDQKALSKVFVELDNRGSKVLLSNSNTDFIKELYSGFTIREVNASRAINCDASKRGRNKNRELIISNYLPVRKESYYQTSLDSI